MTDQAIATGTSMRQSARLSRGVGRAWWTVASGHPFAFVFLSALLLRVVLAVYVYLKYGGSLFLDEQTYSSLAGQAARDETESWDFYSRSVFDSSASFMVPLTALYRVTNGNVLSGQILVAVAGAATAAASARLAAEALPQRWAVAAGLAVGVLPSQVLWSSLTLKDAFVWASLAITALLLCLTIRVRPRRLILVLLALIGTLLFLGGLREHTAVVACWAVVLAVAATATRHRLQRLGVAVVAALVLPVVIGAGVGGIDLIRTRAGSLPEQRALAAEGAATAVVQPLGESSESVAAAADAAAATQASERAAAARSQSQRLLQEAADLAASTGSSTTGGDVSGEAPPGAAAMTEDVERRRTEILERAQVLERESVEAEAEAARLLAQAPDPPTGVDDAFGGGIGASAAAKNLAYLPAGWAVMVLQPYPWQPSPSDGLRLAKAEMLLWYPLLLLACVGVWSVRRSAPVLMFPFIVAGATATMWALVEGNFGTAFRHRGEFVWAIALLAAVGGHALSRRLRSERAISITGRAELDLPHGAGPAPVVAGVQQR